MLRECVIMFLYFGVCFFHGLMLSVTFGGAVPNPYTYPMSMTYAV